MNLHVCGLEVASELAEIMCVSRQIISPQSNKPIINLVQDSVVAEFLMTAATQTFTKAQASQIVMAIQHPLPGKPLLPPPQLQQPGGEECWTGKQIFSLLIPDGVYLDERVRDGTDQNEGHVVVLNGELVKGKLCKRSMSALIHVIFNDCGHEAAGRFISDAQRILVEYLLLRGFSVGIKDCIDAPGATQGVAKIVAETFAHVTHTYTTGRGMPAATVEACVTKSLQTVITRAGGVVRSCIRPDNGFAIMVESGAKGSPINLAQILGVVGQQSVEGARIAPAAAGNRTLPCFMAGDASPAARGFVVNSYVCGLTPQEYFTHAMGGREGLADTAVKTANTGYLQRRMMTMMMNLKVAYDGTVRNARDEVVQRVYGGDGYDSTALEKKSVPGFKAGRAEALAWAGDPGCATQFLLLQTRLRAAWLISGTELQTTVYMPFDVLRVLARHTGKSSSARATNADVASALDGLCADMVATLGDLPTLSTRAYLRYWFTPRLVVTERHMSRVDLRAAATEIERKFHRAVVQPGEMVGAVGASSIGEPMTQLTLNSVAPHEQILLSFDAAKSKVVCIGDWIDACLKAAAPDKIVHIPENRTEYLDISPLGAWVPSVDSSGKSSWQRVLAVTRHLPVGNLVRVTTHSGRSVTATRQKSFLVWNGAQFEPTDGADVKVGDLLPTHFRMADFSGAADTIPGATADMGVQVGAYLATGGSVPKWTQSETLLCGGGGGGSSSGQCVPAMVLTGPAPFARGVINGYFATVNASAPVNDELFAGIAQLCARFGIFVRHAKGGSIVVDFDMKKTEDVVFDAVVSVEEIPPIPFVYDLTVENTKKFALLGGLGMEDTFHYAGVGSKNVTLGVPRLKELIDVSHNIKTPSLTVRFPHVLSSNETHVRMLSAALEHLPMVRVVQSSSVELEPDVWVTRFDEDAHPVRLAAGMHNPEEGVEKFSKWVARFKVDKAQLMQRNLTITHVADAMRRFLAGDAQVVRSEPSMMDWVVRVRMRDMPLLLQDVLEEGGGDSLALERIMMQEIHDHLLDIPVQGVPGIRKASARLERGNCVVPETGALEVRSEWVTDTQGTNLEAVMELAGVDAIRTTSNDIHEVAQILGIEVASRVLYDEIKNVLSFDGTYVNERHVRLLVDAMTRTGSALPVTRHGMRELGSGVFARASFEETLEVINQAAAFGEEDPLRGVTEAVLIGKLAPAGTGSMSIISKAALKPAAAPRIVLVAPLVRERFDPSGAGSGAGSEPSSLIVRPLPPRHGHHTMEVDFSGGVQASEHQASEHQASELPWVGRKRIKKDQHSDPKEGQQRSKVSTWAYTPLSPKVAASAWTYAPKSPLK